MIFLNWNMGWSATISDAITAIKSIVANDSFVITLQEIGYDKAQALIEAFENIANIEHSLTYRPRGKREPRNRELGIMILVSKDIELVNAKVWNNALLPERTLYIETMINQKLVKIASLHSITGCDHKRAKSLQFYAFADAVDKYKPDIISFDANEPEVDAPSVYDMKFYDNKDKGVGAKTFFVSLLENGLTDSLISSKASYNNGHPLAISHEVKNRGSVRYDFIFVNEEYISVEDVTYNLRDAKKATGDHAFVIMKFTI